MSLFIAILASSLLLLSCKGSKCDCPSFAPKKHRSELIPILNDDSVAVFA
ncbi:MAG: hypothetical protein H6579_00535 [Chitinophagales bacterium]|nr:hypothetical protein [Chitinophagales bacterium]